MQNKNTSQGIRLIIKGFKKLFGFKETIKVVQATQSQEDLDRQKREMEGRLDAIIKVAEQHKKMCNDKPCDYGLLLLHKYEALSSGKATDEIRGYFI